MNKMPCHITDLPDPEDYPEPIDTYDFDRQREIDELNEVLRDIGQSQDELRKAIKEQAG